MLHIFRIFIYLIREGIFLTSLKLVFLRINGNTSIKYRLFWINNKIIIFDWLQELLWFPKQHIFRAFTNLKWKITVKMFKSVLCCYFKMYEIRDKLLSLWRHKKPVSCFFSSSHSNENQKQHKQLPKKKHIKIISNLVKPRLIRKLKVPIMNNIFNQNKFFLLMLFIL